MSYVPQKLPIINEPRIVQQVRLPMSMFTLLQNEARRRGVTLGRHLAEMIERQVDDGPQ